MEKETSYSWGNSQMPFNIEVFKRKINSLRHDNPILLFKLHSLKYMSYLSLSHSKPANPTFIIGCGRSGTTILSRLLRHHPEIAAFPGEENHLWHPKIYPWYRTTPPCPPFWVNPYEYTKYSIETRTAIDDSIIKRLFGTFQRLVNRRIFLCKSAMVTFMISYIDELFDKPRYIHIYRDGRAVALSYAKKEKSTININPGVFKERGYFLDFDKLLIRSAILWTEHIMEVERMKPILQDRIIEIAYEDLVSNTSGVLNTIFQFLGIDSSSFRLSPRTKLTNMNYKVSNELTKEKLRKISDAISDSLRIKGYKIDVVE